LTISGSPADNDALTDGWGTMTDNLVYGWRFDKGLNPTMLGDFDTTNDQTDPDGFVRLVVQSYGKDQTANGLPTNDFIDDYPPNIRQNDAGAYYPNPLVDKEDWLVDVSQGISVNFIKSTRALPISSCSDPSKTKKSDCVAPATWYGICNIAGHYNHDSCVAVTTPQGIWGYCSDGASATEAACTLPATWGYCSDGVSTDPATCNAAIGTWATKGFGCSDQSYTTKATCEDESKTWYGCTDGAGTALASCTTAWFVSTKETSILPTTKTPICMKVFYRKTDSTIGVLVSDKTNDETTVHFDPNVISADGSAQTIRFTNFRDSTITSSDFITSIPIGSNAIGIYQYDGTSNGCKSDTMPYYPSDRQNPIQVDFHANTTLPVINW
jgi:hypothetical protein